MGRHQFGGSWTEEKLVRVKTYLQVYSKIFHTNKKARNLNTIYVDAFAGTGYRANPKQVTDETTLFAELEEPETVAFLKGSVINALEVEPSFSSYIFIERDTDRMLGLMETIAEFPEKARTITVIKEDANAFIKRWCATVDWSVNRAVMFLDPYGMQVEWNSLQAIAATKAIDLWILFPLGMGVNRLLTKRDKPPEEWCETLTKLFGTVEWQTAFYHEETVHTLFGSETKEIKQADFKSISSYFIDRLKTIFEAVAPKPLYLLNSKNNPLFLLCFAAGNPKGGKIAVKIAQHLLN